jgi:hypothetical protein
MQILNKSLELPTLLLGGEISDNNTLEGFEINFVRLFFTTCFLPCAMTTQLLGGGAGARQGPLCVIHINRQNHHNIRNFTPGILAIKA